MDNRFITELKALCAAGGIPISDAQLEQMNAYYEILRAENQKYNLTAVTTPEEAALKHFYDSIVPCGIIEQDASLVDVGSGGGFPGVPLKIMRPDIQVTALESSQKKCTFIETAARAAGVAVTTVSARAEEEARGPLRESFDVLTARAVAALPVLVEITSGLVKPDGMLLLYKADYTEEIQAAEGGLKKLNLEFSEAIALPGGNLAHFVLVFRKTGSTPAELPRRYAQIKKKPL
ncbi:MAG: 16S rRNA (guanine(527)-N(7))-methyltransferase RsmG [Clostridia bacterium]|nr:16S rRNA (guanine(527)-N(7))-methyltransferase RsmG [Clostridia bacterium]